MGEEALIASVGDGLGNWGVVEFLMGVDFVAARITARMEVTEKVDIGFDRSNDVAFHDLHVIDVE